MCGICVVVSDRGPVTRELVHDMCERIVHRGPNSEGLFVQGPVGLGMRRLSIIDLEGGHQPIFNEDRSIAIVFNGEIYNFQELRKELLARGHKFETHSDTEAIVHAYEEWGDHCVDHLRGMFTFAIHELRTGRVFFARDRLGIKPLNYVEQDGVLYVASELKSLLAVPGLRRTLDEVAVDQYLALCYIPAPRTIFREIKKLPAGHVLIKEPGKPAVTRRYWRLISRPDHGPTEEEWIEELRRHFDEAVKCHLVADVPLGVFLSGGVDSSGIVASMSRAGGTVRSFAIGFPAEYASFDERKYARIVAERYGTQHTELEVEPKIEDAIYRLAKIFDEPNGESGAVPNLLVCELARKHLTVALSGLGGDELAGGYQRYLGVLVAEHYRKIPAVLRDKIVRPLIEMIPESAAGLRGVDQAKRFVRSGELPWLDRFFAFSSYVDRGARQRLYTPAFRERVQLDSALGVMQGFADEQGEADLLNKILCVDQQTYMVDDLLAVADRTSMAPSLEVRVPFLDHPFVEFMATIPGKFKIQGREKKSILKKAFLKDVPREVLYRTKAGFSLPLARWMREDLTPLLDRHLAPEALARQGWFDPTVIQTMRREHGERKRNHAPALWSLLMLELWAENYL